MHPGAGLFESRGNGKHFALDAPCMPGGALLLRSQYALLESAIELLHMDELSLQRDQIPLFDEIGQQRPNFRKHAQYARSGGIQQVLRKKPHLGFMWRQCRVRARGPGALQTGSQKYRRIYRRMDTKRRALIYVMA
jgi:hypothetical protein